MHKKEMRELLCSMLLGDGSLVVDRCLHRNTNNFIVHYSMGHSTKQSDYLQFKANEINKLFEKKKISRRCKIHTPYAVYLRSTGKTYHAQKAKLHWASYLKFLYWRIYKNKKGKKVKAIDYLLKNISSDKHLFMWFGDDGCESRSKSKHKDSGNSYYLRPRLKLYINNFTFGEAQIIRQWFESNYDVKPYIHHSGKINGSRPVLAFSPDDSEKIFQRIRVYIKQIPSMKKKFWLHLERY